MFFLIWKRKIRILEHCLYIVESIGAGPGLFQKGRVRVSWGPKSPSGCPSGKGLSYRGLGSWDEIPEAKAKMLNCYSDLSLGRDGGSVSLFRGLVSLFRMEQFICHHKSRRLAQNCGGGGRGCCPNGPNLKPPLGIRTPYRCCKFLWTCVACAQ